MDMQYLWEKKEKKGLELKEQEIVISQDAYSSYNSLRKVEGKSNHVYNIINIGPGTNLDNNGEGVYVSSLEHDSNTNPYQHWIFIKIKNNIYYIANVRNEPRSLDEALGFDTLRSNEAWRQRS
ncbi:hypothetical protein C1646_757972 [Rhizophagus diaphanus]|nr:hypothetical protein C1646_757972 [Rhizophagus diaphanus] [Rhizophagus sp. MUCL 43196]